MFLPAATWTRTVGLRERYYFIISIYYSFIEILNKFLRPLKTDSAPVRGDGYEPEFQT
jgi:hypothetical protein